MPINNKAKTLTIVSRRSRLALRQAEIVKQQLLNLYQDYTIDILGITTAGDEVLDKPLNKLGGKGLFVTELEEYLLQDKADIAVHSVKDLPATLAPGLGLAAILKRADPRDVLLSTNFTSLEDLPVGSVLGTSSLRRQAQALAINPGLVVEPLRGNVETRIQKLLDGKYSAIILAVAGLERLRLLEWLNYPLDTEHILPAVGQGALGIEYKLDNVDIKNLLAPLNDNISAGCIQAERALSAKLDGGCQAPIAGLATYEGGLLTLRGLVAAPDGKKIYTHTHTGQLHEANNIGERVADHLLSLGAADIINALKLTWQNNDW